MGNKCKGNDDRFKKKIENNNVVLKNLVNYYPKIQLTYLGSKNHTFFFGDRYVGYQTSPINFIVIQQQFSLNGQQKVLKRWNVDFKNIAFINASNQFIALCDHEIQKWEIDSYYNLSKNVKTLLNFPVESLSFPLFFQQASFQLQLGIKDDWIVASKQRKIFFLQKEMEGIWSFNYIMEIDLKKYIINEQGNVLIILQNMNFASDSNFRFNLVVYVKNNFGQWKVVKEMKASKDGCYFCFLDNDEFAVMQKELITIWQLESLKLEVALLQKFKLDQKSNMQLYGLRFIKQTKLLVAQSRFAIYFIKKVNDKFYVKQIIEIEKGMLQESSEGLLINFQSIFEKQGIIYRSRQIEIWKIYEN